MRIFNYIFNIFPNSALFNCEEICSLYLCRVIGKGVRFLSNGELRIDRNARLRSYLLADHHGRGHVPGGTANNAQLIKSEDEEEAHQASDGPLSAAAARQQHIAL